MKNILLIGGEGYIGNAVALKLLRDSYLVTSLDYLLYRNNHCSLNKRHFSNYHFVYGDMFDTNVLKPLIEKSLEISIKGKIDQGYSEDGESSITNIEIINHSSADIILENHTNYTFENYANVFTVKGFNSIILRTKVGKRKIKDHLNFKVLNGIIAPKEYLKIKLATGI